MNFNKHSDFEGKHAFLSASKYHWLNYDNDKLANSYRNWRAAERGTELHDFARRAIEYGIKLSKSNTTLNMFVNDAIGYGMTPEQVLLYSPNCYGTTDAILYDEKKKILRIHDYKSGVTIANMAQLKIYAAIFCLEYRVDPRELKLLELRIYQNDERVIEQPDPQEIRDIMDRIVEADKLIDELRIGDQL